MLGKQTNNQTNHTGCSLYSFNAEITKWENILYSWSATFMPFIQFMRFSQQVSWGGLLFPPLGKIEGRRRRGHLRMRWLEGITDATHMNLGRLGRWWGPGRTGVLQSVGPQRDMTGQLNSNDNTFVPFTGCDRLVSANSRWKGAGFKKKKREMRIWRRLDWAECWVWLLGLWRPW